MYWGRGKIFGISKLQLILHSTITGNGHTFEIHSKIPKSVKIICYGDNHHLIISKGVHIKRGTFWFEDSNCEIRIGENTTIESAHIAVAEDGRKVVIGEDCMFSKNIRLSFSDSHAIIQHPTGKRLNPAQDIVIDNHVWLGYQVTVTKGVHIEHDSVIGTNSVVTKKIPANVVAAGIPAHVIKTGTSWSRERKK